MNVQKPHLLKPDEEISRGFRYDTIVLDRKTYDPTIPIQRIRSPRSSGSEVDTRDSQQVRIVFDDSTSFCYINWIKVIS